MESQHLKNVVEAALLAAGGPLTVEQIKNLFGDNSGPDGKEIREVLTLLQKEYADRGIEIRKVSSGYRVQVRDGMAQWLSKLWEERPPRYSRALMETLAIIAYRQPVTRGDIEDIRGVTVTTNIIRTLLERDWIKVVGHRDVPGKPAMFGTTRFFLDYFGLQKLDELPPLAELAALEPVSVQLELGPDSDGVPPRVPDVNADRDDGDDDGEALYDEDDAINEAAIAEAPVGFDTDAAEGDDEPPTMPADDGDADNPVNIASLDDARAASQREPETDFNAERAEVVPLKSS